MSDTSTQLALRLTRIETDLLEMAEEVAVRVGEVTTALLEADVGLADELIIRDDELDLRSLRVEEGCIEALVEDKPAGTDLRFVVAAIHINTDIERSGDLATNIAKAVGRLQGAHPDDRIRELVARMAGQAQALIRSAAESIASRDGFLAASIDEQDDVLDELHRRFIQEVIQDARRGGLEPQQSLQLALVGRFYERIGDHAGNIGDRVRYVVDGWLPEAQAAGRARERIELGAGALPNRGLAVIDSIAAERRIDAIRRDFVANVSHELKTPVAAMSLLAETMAGETDAAGRDRLAELLHAESRRVEDIIDDLLELTRLEEGEDAMRPLCVADVVRRSVEAVEAFARANNVELVVVDPLPGGDVWGDRRELVRALTNVLDNAVRYSDPGGAVTIGAEAADAVTMVWVRDTGIGIPRPDLERIFERFYRVDQARSRETGGTGLGLAIVRHVAHNHGGKVLVESKPGEGSTFTLQLPTTGPGSS